MNKLSAEVLSKISTITFSDGKLLKDFISELVIKENDIGFSIDIGKRTLSEGEHVRSIVEKKIAEIDRIGKVSIILTSQNPASREKTKVKYYIDNVKKVVLVAAGKGGVGKSTIAALIAEELQASSKRVGIVDADIYGPSIPQMFGISGKPEVFDKKMIPHISRGIQINSIGFLSGGETIAWRGPMASKAIYQLLSLTAWENLDYLIIDMPPGTGDIHLSVVENYHIDGVVIVTTPQKISEIDVQKAIQLYRKFNLPILGIIENMSYLLDSVTGNHLKVFAGESGEYLSEKYNIPLIAKLPIISALSQHCDEGKSLHDLIYLNIKDFL